MSDEIVVLGRGPVPASWMIVGEAPGREEAARGRPFVGKSGQEQDAYLARFGLSTHNAYITNVCKLYIEGNPDPTPKLIAEWSPVLQDEIERVQPQLIVAVGRFAVRWFLGDATEMDAVHGLPHRSPRAPDAVIVPVYHPAYGFYDGDMRAVISWDYEQVAKIHRLVMTKHLERIEYPEDGYAGCAVYRDVTGAEFADAVLESGGVIGLDTEGVPGAPWSIQVSTDPGTGLVLRCSQPDFRVGIEVLQSAVTDGGFLVAIHNAMYDMGITREMGLELRDAGLWDTMYAAYLTRLEPQGLKPLAYRWLGIKMRSYDETVGDAGRDRQADYLGRVLSRAWPKPEPQVITDNAGQSRLYKPQSVERRAESILVAMYNDHEVDPVARWRDIDESVRKVVERELGPFPVGSLADLPLQSAVDYAARDADATLRLFYKLQRTLHDRKLSGLMAHGMEVLPIFEEMQATGMHASRSYFQKFNDDLNTEMDAIRTRLSYECYQGKPFNPASSDQVAAIMRRRSLEGAERTSTGKVSTAKKSIEHLRAEDKAMEYVMDWRERQKVRDAFVSPILARGENEPPEVDLYPVRCQIKVTRVQTRRLAAANPNMLAIPARGDLGKRVRDGFQAPDGQLFGAWDLSQIELRYLAHISGDPTLCKRFCSGADVHAETAAEIFRIPVEQVDKMKHRYPAKRAGFGIVYGISGSGLYAQLRMMGGEDWSVQKCDDLIEKWLDSYPGVRAYIHDARRRVRQTGVVRDCWGMPRYLPGAWSSDRKIRAEAERTAVSHEVQGGAQGMIQNSMRWLRPIIRDMQRAGMGVHWVLQIHDEIVLRFDEELWDAMNALVIEALTEHHGVDRPKVPIEAEGNHSKSWGGLK